MNIQYKGCNTDFYNHNGRCFTSCNCSIDGAFAVYTTGAIAFPEAQLGNANWSQSLIDDIINSVNNLVYQGISSLENGLTATPPARLGFKPSKAAPNSGEDGDASVDYPGAKQEIEEGLHQLETLLESTVDKNFDKFEIYVLRNILSVPEDLAGWIRLNHYQVCFGLCYLSLPFAALIPGSYNKAKNACYRTCHIHLQRMLLLRSLFIYFGAESWNHSVFRGFYAQKYPAMKPSLRSSKI